MHENISKLLRERTGHFEFESGHHGETWLELETLFQDPALVQPVVKELASRISVHSPEVVCGPLTEGAFLGLLVALELKVPFCYTERKISDGRVDYHLPRALEGLVKGKEVAVVDDVVNAGSAVEATVLALERAQARPVVIGAMVTYGANVSEFAGKRDLQLLALDTRPSRIWEARDCPLCAQGVPLEGRA